MNIVLIHPYIHTSSPSIFLNEPLGLLCLATYISEKSKGKYKVHIVDLYEKGYDKCEKNGSYYNIGISDPNRIAELVSDKSPDVIGITCNFTTYTKATYETVNILKDNLPHIPVIVGGAHATMDPKEVLELSKADVVVRGEGEITFQELLTNLENNRSIDRIPGITYRKNGEMFSTSDRALLRDIDELPIPDRNFINQKRYSDINKQLYFLSKGNRIASIITSRGCPFKCTFCSTKVVWKRSFRPRSAKLVINEIDYLINKYDIDEFIINDDQFFADKERSHKILDRIIDKKKQIHINIASGTSVWLIDKSLLIKLKKAGMYRVTFPIEVGNEKSREYINKKIDFNKTYELIKMANRLGIWTYANFIIGFPYEKEKEIRETIKYAVSLGLDNATFFIAKPYAGSEMYNHFKKEGLLKLSEATTMNEVDTDTVYLKKEDLQRIRDHAQRLVYIRTFLNYINPLFFLRYVLPKLKSCEGVMYSFKYAYHIIVYQILRPVSLRLKGK